MICMYSQAILWNSFWHYLYFVPIDSLKSVEAWYYSRNRDQMGHIYSFYKKQLQLLAYGQPGRNLFLHLEGHFLLLLSQTFKDECRCVEEGKHVIQGHLKQDIELQFGQ